MAPTHNWFATSMRDNDILLSAPCSQVTTGRPECSLATLRGTASNCPTLVEIGCPPKMFGYSTTMPSPASVMAQTIYSNRLLLLLSTTPYRSDQTDNRPSIQLNGSLRTISLQTIALSCRNHFATVASNVSKRC